MIAVLMNTRCAALKKHLLNVANELCYAALPGNFVWMLEHHRQLTALFCGTNATGTPVQGRCCESSKAGFHDWLEEEDETDVINEVLTEALIGEILRLKIATDLSPISVLIDANLGVGIAFKWVANQKGVGIKCGKTRELRGFRQTLFPCGKRNIAPTERVVRHKREWPLAYYLKPWRLSA
jgi:hypothetical protein